MDLGWPEVLLILVIVLIVFGVGKLPQVGKQMGKAVREFRQAQHDDEEDKKDTKALAAQGSGAGTVVIESSAEPVERPSRQNPQEELATTKARLEAAEARLKELEGPKA